MAQSYLVVAALPAAYPKDSRPYVGIAGETPATTVYGVGDGLLAAGCGVVVEEGAQLPKPVADCCRAAVVPTLLRIASPIAA
jgi:hypothetical protein